MSGFDIKPKILRLENDWNKNSNDQCAPEGREEETSRPSSIAVLNDTKQSIGYSMVVPAWSNYLGWSQPEYYCTIQCANLLGKCSEHNKPTQQVLGRSRRGLEILSYASFSLPGGKSNGALFVSSQNPLTDLADINGWHYDYYYPTIQLADIDGDGKDEVIARSAKGIRAWKLGDDGSWHALPDGPEWSDAKGWAGPKYNLTIQCADIDGDGAAELLGRYKDGMHIYKYYPDSKMQYAGKWVELLCISQLDDGYVKSEKDYLTIQCADINGDKKDELVAFVECVTTAFEFKYNAEGSLICNRLRCGPGLPSKYGWDKPQSYMTLQFADIDGDHRAELIGKSATRICAWKYISEDEDWHALKPGPRLPNVHGWSYPQFYMTIQCADIDGDGRAELLWRDHLGLQASRYEGEWKQLDSIATFSDKDGWDKEQYYLTIQCADINGDGRAEVIARNAWGPICWCYGKQGKWEAKVPYSYTSCLPSFQMNLDCERAYCYISGKLMGRTEVCLRSQYSNINQDPAIWFNRISNLKRPKYISQKGWDYVTTKLQKEIAFLSLINIYFLRNANNLIQDTLGTANLTLLEVATMVQLEYQKPPDTDLLWNIFQLAQNIIVDVAKSAGPEAAIPIAIITDVMAFTSTATKNAAADGEAIKKKFAELANWLISQYQQYIDLNIGFHKEAVTEWALMSTLGEELQAGRWYFPDYMGSIIGGVNTGFKKTLYQALMPLKYQIFVKCNSKKKTFNDAFRDIIRQGCKGFHCPKAPEWVGWRKKVSQGQHDFYMVATDRETSDHALHYPAQACMEEIYNLASKGDFFLGLDGWQLPRGKICR